MMRRVKNQNRTFHLLQKADIFTCYEQGTTATWDILNFCDD